MAHVDRVQNSLLPANLEASWLSTPVSQYSVQGDPRRAPNGTPSYKDNREKLGELEAVRQSILTPFDIHAECSGPGRLALIRKLIPHGMNEMTVMAQEGYDDEAIDNLFGFPPEIRSSFYSAGAAFAHFSEANGLYPVISYTYDPLTRDRKAAQSVKNFHLQLTARTPEELASMQRDMSPLVEHKSSVERRQLVDEAAVVGSLVFNDYFIAHPLDSLQPIAPFSQDACSNIRFEVGKEWEDIKKASFDNDLKLMHVAMNEIYKTFSQSTMIGENGQWRRQKVVKQQAYQYLDTLTWMQDSTRDAMKYYIAGLQEEYLDKVSLLKARGLTSHIYPLSGFTYGATLTRGNEGLILLSIRPMVFAEAGSTGLQYLDPVGGHVRMMRNAGEYNDDELREKMEFETNCVAYIVNHQTV